MASASRSAQTEPVLGTWILPSRGGPMTQLTTDPTPDWNPRWSPDSQQITFYAYRSGNRDIWVMPAGGGPARQLTTHPASDEVPSWSPNGQEIAFASLRSGNYDLWVVPVEGGEPRQVTADLVADWNSHWSPDGASIFVTGSGLFGSVGWRKVPLDGSEPEVLGFGNSISPDGHVRYYRDGDNVLAESQEDGSVRVLADLAGRSGNQFEVNGGYLYFVSGQQRADIWVMDVVQDDGSDD